MTAAFFSVIRVLACVPRVPTLLAAEHAALRFSPA
jgi:hypothetical protein